MWRPGGQYREEYQNKGRQLEPARDSNAMEVDRKREGDRICFVCGKWNYMAKNCWQRKKREGKVVEMLQESAKDNRGQ